MVVLESRLVTRLSCSWLQGKLVDLLKLKLLDEKLKLEIQS